MNRSRPRIPVDDLPGHRRVHVENEGDLQEAAHDHGNEARFFDSMDEIVVRGARHSQRLCGKENVTPKLGQRPAGLDRPWPRPRPNAVNAEILSPAVGSEMESEKIDFVAALAECPH